MRITTSAIVIKSYESGEDGFVVQCLTPDHGFVSGYMSRQKKRFSHNVVTSGNLVSINIYKREGAFGRIVPELQTCYTSSVLEDKSKLFSILCVCDLLQLFFEKDSNETDQNELFFHVLSFLNEITKDITTINTLSRFVLICKHILTYAGYGFSLNSCVVTNINDIAQLKFLSPKSASAVCLIAAKPYENVLLKLPKFFITNNIQDVVDKEDVLSGMKIIKTFINKFSNNIMHTQIPNNISSFLNSLERAV